MARAQLAQPDYKRKTTDHEEDWIKAWSENPRSLWSVLNSLPFRELPLPEGWAGGEEEGRGVVVDANILTAAASAVAAADAEDEVMEEAERGDDEGAGIGSISSPEHESGKTSFHPHHHHHHHHQKTE